MEFELAAALLCLYLMDMWIEAHVLHRISGAPVVCSGEPVVQLLLESAAAAAACAEAERLLCRAEGQDQWLQCDKCKKWRLVSPRVFDACSQQRHWKCADNFERPNASCDDPPDAGSD